MSDGAVSTALSDDSLRSIRVCEARSRLPSLKQVCSRRIWEGLCKHFRAVKDSGPLQGFPLDCLPFWVSVQGV